MEFEWDEEKAAANLRKHAIDFADAVLVFEDEIAVTVGDPDSRHEERFITMGHGPYGRLLVVVYTWRGERIRLISARTSNRQRTAPLRDGKMRKEYDFSAGKRGPVVPVPKGKTRITIRLDDDILQWFKAQVHAAGGGNYQSLINTALREHVEMRREPLEDTLRRVIREELRTA